MPQYPDHTWSDVLGYILCLGAVRPTLPPVILYDKGFTEAFALVVFAVTYPGKIGMDTWGFVNQRGW